MSRISTVIFDWAGTTVDYGSFAPVAAFKTAFEAFGIEPETDEIRAPMGMQKRAHIEEMLKGERIAALWEKTHGRDYTAADVDRLYAQFEKSLLEVLFRYAQPIPGVISCVEQIRAQDIKIGSTTGYTRAMMDIIEPAAKKNGYAPDCLVCPDESGGKGRPWPYMLWRNLEKLESPSVMEVLKVGDTAADMREAKNAGVLAAGVICGSNMLGLSQTEFAALGENAWAALFKQTEEKYFAAGADYVIEEISALPELIETINQHLKDK
jgi:phosphonoacetaldehyde hydrolase